MLFNGDMQFCFVIRLTLTCTKYNARKLTSRGSFNIELNTIYYFTYVNIDNNFEVINRNINRGRYYNECHKD